MLGFQPTGGSEKCLELFSTVLTPIWKPDTNVGTFRQQRTPLAKEQCNIFLTFTLHPWQVQIQRSSVGGGVRRTKACTR